MKAKEGSSNSSTQLEDSPRRALTYNSYLKIEELKQLQVCLSEPMHHDEPFFIIIHQAYELWFKLILHEIDLVISLLTDNNVPRGNFYLRRIVAVLKLLVMQIHLLETMTPKDFLGFRYKLNPASGFQSSQFREIEFVVGLKDKGMMEHFRHDPKAFSQLEKRFAEPSLGDAYYELLRRRGFVLPAAPENGAEHEVASAEERRVRELTRFYENPNEFPELFELSELLVDLDEQIFLWRMHHVTVVERIIGWRQGTGGSEGVAYLRTTLHKRAFPDLWKVRTAIQ